MSNPVTKLCSLYTQVQRCGRERHYWWNVYWTYPCCTQHCLVTCALQYYFYHLFISILYYQYYFYHLFISILYYQYYFYHLLINILYYQYYFYHLLVSI